MNKTFKYESESLGQVLEVDISIYAAAEDDAGYEIESIVCSVDGTEFKLEQFPESERREIEKRADALCSEYAYDAWNEACEAKGDAMYEAWKDGDR